MKNILSFDIEDWFHILEIPQTADIDSWDYFENRVEKNTYEILNLLDDYNLKATFFILGWVAKRNKKLIRSIFDLGHDIGSHSYHHKLVKNMTRDEFQKDLKESVGVISDIIGDKVNYFRAPGFSYNLNQKYFIETLLLNNINTDCSIFFGNRSHGGVNSLNIDKPFFLNQDGMKIKEYPINGFELLFNKFFFSGGGYFRILNLSLIEYFANQSSYNMFYFHPRDFDYTQPRIPIKNLIRKFKTYVGLKNSKKKFLNLLKRNQFVSISNYDNHFNWKNAKTLDLSF